LDIDRFLLGVDRSLLGVDGSLLGVDRSLVGVDRSLSGVDRSLSGVDRSRGSSVYFGDVGFIHSEHPSAASVRGSLLVGNVGFFYWRYIGLFWRT